MYNFCSLLLIYSDFHQTFLVIRSLNGLSLAGAFLGGRERYFKNCKNTILRTWDQVKIQHFRFHFAAVYPFIKPSSMPIFIKN